MAKKKKPVSVVNLPGYKALLEFMVQRGCRNAKQALMPLKPIFLSAQADDYALLPAFKVNTTEIVHIINKILLDKPIIERVELISLSRPYPRPVWMSKPYYQETFLPNAKEDFWEDIFYNIESAPWTQRLEHASLFHDATLWEQLEDCLQDNLLYKFEDRLDNRVGKFIEDGMRYALMHYLMLCLSANEAERSLFKHLINIWSRCLILGRYYDEPKRLLVLCQ